MKRIFFGAVLSVLLMSFASGCASSSDGDSGAVLYKIVSPEPEWIRNGEPIEYEGELWYPRDTVDILTDSEVSPLGKYREVQFYLQTIDVRPYERLYTKFGKNKFRVFETKTANDKSKKAF